MTYEDRIGRIIEITDLSFDHPDWCDYSDDDCSELFFCVPGGGVHGDLPEEWMWKLNGWTLDDCERELTERGLIS